MRGIIERNGRCGDVAQLDKLISAGGRRIHDLIDDDGTDLGRGVDGAGGRGGHGDELDG